VVRASQVVVTTTPSRQPIIKGAWLHPGFHITAMGADAEHKQELFPDVFSRADLIACDKKSQVFRLGELHHAFEAGTVESEERALELGQLTSGMVEGRKNDHQITVCDLTGVGVQDTQIARLAYQRAVDRGLGVVIGE
jgi:ornithine cyclodeaminase/alanine dehydrogenase-like protein (mu-crystallin family)